MACLRTKGVPHLPSHATMLLLQFPLDTSMRTPNRACQIIQWYRAGYVGCATVLRGCAGCVPMPPLCPHIFVAAHDLQSGMYLLPYKGTAAGARFSCQTQWSCFSSCTLAPSHVHVRSRFLLLQQRGLRGAAARTQGRARGVQWTLPKRVPFPSFRVPPVGSVLCAALLVSSFGLALLLSASRQCPSRGMTHIQHPP